MEEKSKTEKNNVFLTEIDKKSTFRMGKRKQNSHVCHLDMFERGEEKREKFKRPFWQKNKLKIFTQ